MVPIYYHHMIWKLGKSLVYIARWLGHDARCARHDQIITRDLKTIDIDLQKAIKLSKDRDLYNEMVVDRVMAKAVDNFLPEDGDPEQVELSQDRD